MQVRHTFDGTFAREVILEQVLALMALEETVFVFSQSFCALKSINTHPHSGSAER